MAHNLNIENNKASFFGTKTAWHGLGQIVEEAQTSREAIVLAGLDYDVYKSELWTPTKSGSGDATMQVPGKWATVRSDNGVPLGVVGDKYTVLQNRDAFGFIDKIIGAKEAVFQTAGALGKGERVFITAKLPEKCVIGMDDVIDNYFFITSSHDGSGSVEIAFSSVRIVCENTLRMALKSSKRKQRVRHTSSVTNNLLLAADLMGITRQHIQETEELYNAMTKVRITDAELKKFIELAMHPGKEQINSEEFSKRFSNQVERVLTYTEVHPSQLVVTAKGNLFGALQSVTGYYNNVTYYEKPEDKVESIMYGTGFRNSNRALDLAMNVLTNQVSLS
jgi:phage/plasmid-like protein (TIGR03299 family)